VLIDPPYEAADEFLRLAAALEAALHKWPTGVFFAWYPIKNARENAAFARVLKKRRISNMLRAELTVAPASTEGNDGKLRGGGHLIVNPPWTLETDLKILLPALAKILAPGVKDAVRLDWLAAKT
jgi:23S rRNA (adenine2030-N6)-methyltransferase